MASTMAVSAAAIKVWPALDGFLAEDAPAEGVAGSFARLAAALAVR